MTAALSAKGHMGWKELLPAAGRKRILCLDVGNGHATLALAQMYEQVVSVPLAARDAAPIADLVARAGARHVTVVPTLGQGVDGAFDGLVAVLFSSHCSGVGSGAVGELIREAAARIGDGFVLLAALNALACERRSGRGSRGFQTWGARGLERIAASSGRGHTRIWPVLLSDDAPFEVLHGPYRSPSGHARGVERVKEMLLGVTGAAWFAPGYVTLGQRRASALVMDELLRKVDAACGGESRLRRHLVTFDKTILVTDMSGDERSRVVILPHTPRALGRRSREVEILKRARALPSHLRRLVPDFLGQGKHEGQEWLAIEKMPGVFADTPVADLDQVTERAAGVLMDLHLATRREVQIDTKVYDSLVGGLLAGARDRHPGCAQVLAQIDLRLRAALLGRTMPLVWMHGDYKIENVGIDRDSRQPVAIIDWELATQAGLPLIDLKYLLIYNRIIRGGGPFDAVYRTVAEGGAWSRKESRLLDQYVERLGLDGELRQVLRVLLVVHAVSARFQYDMANPSERRRVIELLETGRDLLTSSTPVRAAGGQGPCAVSAVSTE